jgi:hypothetical protein
MKNGGVKWEVIGEKKKPRDKSRGFMEAFMG